MNDRMDVPFYHYLRLNIKTVKIARNRKTKTLTFHRYYFSNTNVSYDFSLFLSRCLDHSKVLFISLLRCHFSLKKVCIPSASYR